MKKRIFLVILACLSLIVSMSATYYYADVINDHQTQTINIKRIQTLSDNSFINMDTQEIYEFDDANEMAAFIEALSYCGSPSAHLSTVPAGTAKTVVRQSEPLTPIVPGPQEAMLTHTTYNIDGTFTTQSYSFPVPEGMSGAVIQNTSYQATPLQWFIRRTDGHTDTGGHYHLLTPQSEWYSLLAW